MRSIFSMLSVGPKTTTVKPVSSEKIKALQNAIINAGFMLKMDSVRNSEFRYLEYRNSKFRSLNPQ